MIILNKRRSTCLGALLILLLLSFFQVEAQSQSSSLRPQVYFHNQKYTGPVKIIYDELYAPINRISVLLKVIVEKSGNYYCISTKYEELKSLPKRRDALIYVDGIPLKQGVSVQNGEVLVSLRSLAQALKLAYIYNPDTQIADIIRTTTFPEYYNEKPYNEKPVTEASVQSEKSRNAVVLQNVTPSDKTIPVEKDLNKEGELKYSQALSKTGSGTWNAFDGTGMDPIVLENVDFRQEPFSTTGETRYSGIVRNKSNKAVEGVTATCQFLDQDGKVIHSETQELGIISAGSSKDVLFYWVNTSRLNVIAQIRLNWEGKEKSNK